MPDADSLNNSIGPSQQQLVDEALAWLVRLNSGHSSDEDYRECQVWRAKSDAHRIAYQEAETLWHDVGNVQTVLTTGHTGSFTSPPSERYLVFQRGLRSSRKTWAIVACVLLAVGLFSMEHTLQCVTSAMADYRTGVGEQRIITLEDGSAIHLNTDTALNVVFSENGRMVHLLKGEASFAVTPDPVRPFVVKSGTIQARALGTAFVVRRYSDRITVTVTEHQVQVGSSSNAAGRVFTVREGERIAYSATEGFTSVQRIHLGNETAWQRGKVIFEAQPLSAVIEELNRYRQGRIAILNPAVRALKVTGLFSVADPDSALRIIQHTIPIHHTNITPYLVLLH